MRFTLSSDSCQRLVVALLTLALAQMDNPGDRKTVSREVKERYSQLISDFHQSLGMPIALNTFFNKDEPIVWTPAPRD